MFIYKFIIRRIENIGRVNLMYMVNFFFAIFYSDVITVSFPLMFKNNINSYRLQCRNMPLNLIR